MGDNLAPGELQAATVGAVIKRGMDVDEAWMLSAELLVEPEVLDCRPSPPPAERGGRIIHPGREPHPIRLTQRGPFPGDPDVARAATAAKVVGEVQRDQ